MSSVILSQLVIETPTLSMFFLFNVFCAFLVAAICLLRFLKSEYVLAWISFRTIEVMSVISAVESIPGLNNKRMVESAIDTVKFGNVFPFAVRSLLAAGKAPQIQVTVLERYYRAAALWEISNSPWALVMGASHHQKYPSSDNK